MRIITSSSFAAIVVGRGGGGGGGGHDDAILYASSSSSFSFSLERARGEKSESSIELWEERERSYFLDLFFF